MNNIKARYITFNCAKSITKIADRLRYTKGLCFLGVAGFLLAIASSNKW